MRSWYIVELRAEYKDGVIGQPISAKIVDCFPRHGDGRHVWRDTESVDNGVLVRHAWCRTKKEAELSMKIWMK